uniref:Uncharacterized protein n=1 Tax=Myotis myotis TaxID=51298 RepID=A0A7J7RDU6_MYOMY|nr:hypothetical protein mMyoMyo1_010375 [Myotis myotis]
MLCEREGWLQAGAGDCSAGPAPSCCPPEPTTPPAARCRGRSGPRCEGCASQGRCVLPCRQPPLPQPLSKTGGWLCSEHAGGAVAPAGVAPRPRLRPGRSGAAGYHCHQPADFRRVASRLASESSLRTRRAACHRRVQG